MTCLECGTPRRYVYKPAKIPWIDREEAWEDKVVHGKMVTEGNKQNQKQNSKGQGQQKAKKQESSSNKTEDIKSSANLDKDKNQTHLQKSKKRKLDNEKWSTNKAQLSDHDYQSCSDQTNASSAAKTDHCPLKPDTCTGKILHNPNSCVRENESVSDKDILQLAANVAKGKASVENSPNPNERIEETEERPDEYLYKMTFVQGFFPYLR